MSAAAPVVGVLHPGAMGSSVAAACSGDVCWVSEGRSAATAERATGLREVATLADLVEQADVIVSVCPPGEALAVARSVAELGYDGVYVDANAVSPETATQIGALFDRFVDGGIVGPPALRAGTTRLYLSGDDAEQVAALWHGSPLDARVIDGGAGAASALKMCFAGWTKATSALLLAINAAAEHHGVADALRSEWSISLPDLAERSERTAAGTGPKAWRFADEMREIAATLDAADLPDGFHLAAAQVYERMAGFKDEPAPTLADVIAALDVDVG